MDFRFNEDQLSLQKGAREFLQKECTSDIVRNAFESADGDAADLYSKMAGLGWLGLAVPEQMGGVGYGVVEQCVLQEQLGFFNAPSAFFSQTCLAIPALVMLGAADEVSAAIEGSRRYALVIDPDFVLDGHLCDRFLVVTDQEVRLVESSDAKVTAHATIDGTRRTASVDIAAGAGVSLGSNSDIQKVIDAGTALLCAESVGGMQRILDLTVDYARVRTQFGRPIGSFQAVKHQLADVLLKVESSRSAAYYAAWANAVDAPDAQFATSVAKAYVSDAAQWVTGEGIQLHGGIGFTWEHDAHLYFKRAVMNAQILGDSAFHQERALMLSLPGAHR